MSIRYQHRWCNWPTHNRFARPFSREHLCTTLDAEQALAHHKRVADLHQDRIDRDRRLAPVVGATHARDELCVPGVDRLEQPEPGAASFLLEHQPIRLHLRHQVGCVGCDLACHRNPVSNCEVLKLRDDPLGAAAAEIVEQIIAIPTCETEADLNPQAFISQSHHGFILARNMRKLSPLCQGRHSAVRMGKKRCATTITQKLD